MKLLRRPFLLGAPHELQRQILAIDDYRQPRVLVGCGLLGLELDLIAARSR